MDLEYYITGVFDDKWSRKFGQWGKALTEKVGFFTIQECKHCISHYTTYQRFMMTKYDLNNIKLCESLGYRMPQPISIHEMSPSPVMYMDTLKKVEFIPYALVPTRLLRNGNSDTFYTMFTDKRFTGESYTTIFCYIAEHYSKRHRNKEFIKRWIDERGEDKPKKRYSDEYLIDIFSSANKVGKKNKNKVNKENKCGHKSSVINVETSDIRVSLESITKTTDEEDIGSSDEDNDSLVIDHYIGSKIKFTIDTEKDVIDLMIKRLYHTNEKFYNFLDAHENLVINKPIHLDKNGWEKSRHFNGYFVNNNERTHEYHFYIKRNEIVQITMITTLL